MVFEFVRKMLCEHFACDEQDVELTSTLNELNFAPGDRTELAFLLSEHYGVTISDNQSDAFETVEDVVACVEDLQQ